MYKLYNSKVKSKYKLIWVTNKNGKRKLEIVKNNQNIFNQNK